MNMETLQTFLGYCTVINVGILLLSSVFLVALQEKVSSLHAKIFHIDQDVIRSMYFNYLATYKILVIVFNFVPYLALSLV